MKATEFFKKVGVDAVKSYIAAYEDHLTDELQTLVNAYELVEKYRNTYGESARWFFIAEYCKEHRLAPHQSDVYDFVAAKYDSYVALAESCT